MSQNNQPKPSLVRGGIATPIGRNNSSAAMDSIRKALEELGVNNQFGEYEFKFIELDTSGQQRKVAAMIVAARHTRVEKSPIAYHAILIEATGTAQVAKRRYDNITFEDLLYPSDGFDGWMQEDVVKAVASAFMPGAQLTLDEKTGKRFAGGVQLLNCMASTLPSTVNLKEPTEVRGPLSNATIAVMTLLNQALDLTDLFRLEGNVAAQRWVAHVLTSNASFTDPTGTPNRGTLVVELREGGNDTNNNVNNGGSFNDPAGEVLTHQILGFMDFIYDPTMAASQMAQTQGMYSYQASMMGMPMSGMMADSMQVMRPRYVITHLDAIFNPTLPDILFGLVVANEAILENNRWMPALINQHNLSADDPINGKNLRDLGILGTEVWRPGIGEQAGQMVKTRFSTTGKRGEDEVLAQIIKICFRPEPIMSMHVPESGAFSWMSGHFVAAAMGNPYAHQDIIAAANYMTRDQFGPIYDRLTQGAQKRTVINDNLLVNLGRFRDHHGMIRDSREVSLIEVMAVFAETRPEMVARWIRMQNDTSMPMEFRLSESRAIIQEMYNSVEFTGRARSITFDPLFIRALAEAVVACGGRIAVRDGHGNPSTTDRVTATFLQGTRFATGASGLHAMSAFQQNPWGQPQAQWGRWHYPMG